MLSASGYAGLGKVPYVHAIKRKAAQGGLSEHAIPDTLLAEQLGDRRTQVTRVLVGHPRPDVTEASVVLVDGSRVRALAIRLVGRDGRWVVEALQIG